jgi:hypothetical protein
VRLALKSGVNCLLLAAIVGLAVLTGEWWTLIAGLGVEVLWLGLGPQLPPVRRKLDQAHRARCLRMALEKERAVLGLLVDGDRRRFEDLDRIRGEIRRLAESNETWASAIEKGQIDKVDRLLGSFLSIASNAARYERYVDTADLGQLERDVERQKKIVEKTVERDPLDLARRNMALLERRLAKSNQIRGQLRTARGQLNLIENTLRLLRDQLITLESPEALGDPLEELTSSLDAIEAGAAETAALVRALEGERSDSGSR